MNWMNWIKVLKDHKNPLMEELVTRAPYRCSFARELESTGGVKILCSQDQDECCPESAVRLTVVNPQFEQPLPIRLLWGLRSQKDPSIIMVALFLTDYLDGISCLHNF